MDTHIFGMLYEDAVEGTAEEAAAAGQTQVKPGDDKRFTQAELDAAINKRFAKEKTEKEKMLADLKKFESLSSTSQKDKEEYGKRIAELESQLLSKDELSRKEADRLEKTKQKEIKSVSDERDHWQSQFSRMKIESDIEKAGTDKDTEVVSTRQIVAMLGSQAKLQKVQIGDRIAYETVLPWTEKDKDGKTVQVELPPKEILKRMKEDAVNYGNLFKSDRVGGTGSAQPTYTGQIAKVDVLDIEAYKQRRKDIANVKTRN